MDQNSKFGKLNKFSILLLAQGSEATMEIIHSEKKHKDEQDVDESSNDETQNHLSNSQKNHNVG